MTCVYCGEPIIGTFSVIPCFDGGAMTEEQFHKPCAMRLVIGGVNHILGRCTCCGGSEPPDPPDLTRRQAAVAAMMAWQRRYSEE